MKAWLLEQSEGRPQFTDWQRADFKEFSLRNPKVKYKLSPLELKRTTLQNNFYRVFLMKIERETGNLADDVHEWAKRKFLEPRWIKIKEDEYKIPGSTTKLSKVDFGEYMDKISAETEISIPNPEEAGFYTK